MGGSSPPLRGAEPGQLLDCPPPLTARSLTRSFVILQASGAAGWGLPWPIRNRRRICVLVSGTSWNVRRGAPSGGGDPRAGRPGGRGGLAGVRASLGLRFQARRGSWGPLSRNSLPTPGWEGAQSFHQGRPPLRPLCPAVSHVAEPGVGSEPDSAPPAEAGLLGGRQRGRKRGLWVLWEEQGRGEHRLGCPGFAACT